jgi:hypothetical protein
LRVGSIYTHLSNLQCAFVILLKATFGLVCWVPAFAGMADGRTRF